MQFVNDLPTAKTLRDTPIDWEGIKAKLIENEGQWGLMVENIAASTPQQLAQGKNKAFRGEELTHFEFAVRKPENPTQPYGKRRTDLWGRYTK